MRAQTTLAIDGGMPVRSAAMPHRLVVDAEERDAILALLDREMAEGGGFDRYGGTEVDAYEREFAGHFGTVYGTATSSGTAAIHTALGALRLEPCSEVISTPITDQGAVMPIVWLQCVPIFADVDPETFNLDPRSVEEQITERTRAIVVTHLAGQPANLDPLVALAREHSLALIEDCAQAHEAVYKGRLVGSFGDFGCFSLMSGKHSVAGGQGGMVLTDDESLYWNAKRFADRGKPFGSTEKRNLFLGMNYRMTELQAAMGRVQLQKLAALVERRRALVGLIRQAIGDLVAVRIGKVIEGAESSYWFLLLKVDASRLSVDKETYARAVAAEGLPVSPSYDHVAYDAPWLRERLTFGTSGLPWSSPACGGGQRYDPDPCPNARQAIAEHMMASVHEGWTEREVDDFAAALRKVERAYLR